MSEPPAPDHAPEAALEVRGLSHAFKERNDKQEKYRALLAKLLFVLRSHTMAVPAPNGVKVVNVLDVKADIGDANAKRKDYDSSSGFDLAGFRHNLELGKVDYNRKRKEFTML